MKKILCLLLVLVMLTGIVACAKSDAPAGESETEAVSGDVVETTPPTSETETPTDTAEDNATLKLPEKNWNGRQFTLLCRTERMDQFGDGEIEFGSTQLDKAVYKRNETVESTYGVKLKYDPVPSWATDTAGEQMTMKVEASAQAGCPDYDAVAPDYYWGIETRGFFTNLLELDYMNFESPWWWKNWNDCYTLNGVLTTAVGWLTLDIVQGMEVVYFDTTRIEEVTDEDPYELVYDKKWTIEKMKQMGADATYNVTNAGALGDDYSYGTILHYMGNRSLFFSLGGRMTSYEDDGSVLYNFATEKNQDVADVLSEWIVGNPEVFYAGHGDFGHNLSSNENPKVTAEMFANGHALFYCYGIKTAELLASLNVEFGVLPPPMLDEDQGEYYTTTFGTSIFCIEKGRTDEQKQFAAYMLEALNYYSYDIVREVYYEKVLKLQYGGTDVETKDMIDMVVQSAYLDFAYLCGAGGLMGSMLSCITTGEDLVSRWITIGSKAEEALAKYLRGYLS